MKKFLLGSVATVFGSFALQSSACETDAMQKTENGFNVKIVAGSDKVVSFKDESASEEAFGLELMQPYFVICDAGEFYKITDIQTDNVEEALSGNVGFAAKDQVYPWTTREALSFSEIAFLQERPEIVAWNDEGVLEKFMETGNRNLHPPAFKENLEATRMRMRATRPYPVLSSELRRLRNVADKRVYEVLLPAAITPKSKVEIKAEDLGAAQDALTSASILLVFDATGSMDSFARATANAIDDALTSLPAEVRDGSDVGFVFYRDADDPDKLVDVTGLPFAEAANALEKASGFMSGGGDAAEPILDALYHASNLYDWGQSGRKIVIGILNGDAKLATTGVLDDGGRVPAGIDVYGIAKDFIDQSIPIITVQAGPDAGPNLETVLTTLAEETDGEFIPWRAGNIANDVAAAVTLQLSKRAGEAIDRGEEVLSKLEYDLNGYPSIPLEVLDGEMLERLRSAGVDFNIDMGEGGVLIREGFILENDDLLSPQIQIEKETLVNLVNLYSVLATVGVDGEAMINAISEAVAAIAGEDYDPSETIEEIIEKKLGIQFRSDLLSFDINYIPAMVPNERLAMTKRIQDASTTLSQYLEANQAEFDEQIAVWMPVSILP